MADRQPPRLIALLLASSRDPVVRLSVGTAALFAVVNAVILALQASPDAAFRASVRAWPATCLALLLTAVSGTAWTILIPFFFTATATILYFLYYFRVPLTSNLIALVVETTPDEVNGLAGWRLASWIILAIALSVPVVALRRRRRWTGVRPAATAVAVAAACTMILPPSKYFAMPEPIGLFEQFAIYWREHRQRERFMAKLVDASAGMTARGDSDLTVVLVLGESARPDHFQINGYARPTSPNLLKLGATSFRDVTACAVITRNAIPCMLRGVAPPPAERIERTSVVSVFQKAGFRTSWISNQGLGGAQSTPLAPLAMESDVRVFTPKGEVGLVAELDDANLLPSVDRALAGGGKRFVLIHTIGSHWKYSLHHPPSFSTYVPECDEATPSRCDLPSLVNAYDNTIAYADHIIGELIRRLETHQALFVFVSDHGEGLGDPYFLHGHTKGLWNGTPEEMRIPLFVWASPSWRSRNPARVRSIERASRSPTTYETIFHSLIDCAGIVIPALDRGKSFCSSRPD